MSWKLKTSLNPWMKNITCKRKRLNCKLLFWFIWCIKVFGISHHQPEIIHESLWITFLRFECLFFLVLNVVVGVVLSRCGTLYGASGPGRPTGPHLTVLLATMQLFGVKPRVSNMRGIWSIIWTTSLIPFTLNSLNISYHYQCEHNIAKLYNSDSAGWMGCNIKGNWSQLTKQ